VVPSPVGLEHTYKTGCGNTRAAQLEISGSNVRSRLSPEDLLQYHPTLLDLLVTAAKDSVCQSC
jgi:hypothetical protein